MSKYPVDALILAAGKGTRMRSKKPKVLHPVCGQSLLRRTAVCLRDAGLEKLNFVVGHGLELVESELESIQETEKVSVSSILQKEQLGTGHAVQIAMDKLQQELVLILPGDVPLLEPETISRLFKDFSEKAYDLAFFSFELPVPGGFGRVVRNKDGQVQLIREAKDCSKEELAINELNSGIYLLKRDLLELALSSLRTDNAQGELYLTDIVEFAVGKEKKVEAILVEDAEQLAGANNLEELGELEAEANRRIIRRHQHAGVRFQSPTQTFVEAEVVIGSDTSIGIGANISGKTTIAEDVSIEAGCTIKNSTIGSGSVIKAGSYIVDSQVGEACNVGPYAHLRPGSVLEAKVKVGNFVEIKKSTLRKGVKAGHLTYLGDAELGEETNVGAGTITCNYDGENKHQTVVGKNSFIGSNSCLVAPVDLGDEVYVAAGSVITEDAPSKSLALGRARQTNKENWRK